MALLSPPSIFLLLLCAFLLSPCAPRAAPSLELSQPRSSMPFDPVAAGITDQIPSILAPPRLIAPTDKDWIAENPSGDSEIVSQSHEDAGLKKEEFQTKEQAEAIATPRELTGNEKLINKTSNGTSNGTSDGQLQQKGGSSPVHDTAGETQVLNTTETRDKHPPPDNEKRSSNSSGVLLSPAPENSTRPAVNNSSSPEIKKPEDVIKSGKSTVDTDTKENSPVKKKDECEESHCEDPSKVISACLRTSGADDSLSDGNTLSLTISNDGADNVNVTVVAPYFLTATTPQLLVKKGMTETVQFRPKTATKGLDSEGENNMSITITSVHGECKIGVPSGYLPGDAAQQKFFESFQYSFITPMTGVYVLLIVLVMVAGIMMFCKCYGRKQPGDGVKYQELEMNVPGVGTPKEKAGKLGEESTDGWDEIWDDDWEDAEAARSSARLSQNLSSRGLAARRGNKDGWDNSWDD